MFRIIHKKNEGLVQARKDGVRNATGAYITFVDGDDWIEPDMYEELMCKIEEHGGDIITSGLIYDYANGTQGFEIDLVSEGIYSKKNIEKEILPVMMNNFKFGRRGIVSSVVNKIYKKSVLSKVIEEVDKNITYGEDAAINYLCISDCNSLIVTSNTWYHYCIRDNSISQSYGDEAFKKIKKFKDFMQDEFEKRGILDIMQYQIERYAHSFVCDAEWKSLEINGAEAIYIFPYEIVDKNSKVAIYGAGCVGKSYYRALERTGYAELVMWVDKAYAQLQRCGFPVMPIEKIYESKYDYLLIAIEDECVAEQIMQYLISCGTDAKKIVWKVHKWN